MQHSHLHTVCIMIITLSVRLVIRGPVNSSIGAGFVNDVMNGTYVILAFPVDVFEIATISVAEEDTLARHWNGAPLFKQLIPMKKENSCFIGC